jgi:hypothetical protein
MCKVDTEHEDALMTELIELIQIIHDQSADSIKRWNKFNGILQHMKIIHAKYLRVGGQCSNIPKYYREEMNPLLLEICEALTKLDKQYNTKSPVACSANFIN